MPRGVVAAGHPQTAEAGADVLRAGGNAVDAAVGAMLVSFAAEPALTGLGAGGYMLVHTPAGEHVLLDFFVEAPGRGLEGREVAPLEAVDVSFGDANQLFHVGPASCGVYGTPAGVCEALDRFGTVPLADLVAPAARLARHGALVTAAQAYILEILWPISSLTPGSAAIYAPQGRPLREGELIRSPEVGDALERLGSDGAAPFYEGDLAAAVVAWMDERGGLITAADLAAYRPIPREPVRASYRGREVLTNPPPSAGGILIAYALSLLEREPSPPSLRALVSAMERANEERTSEFMAGLYEEGFTERFLAGRVGSTTHIATLDAEGWACSVTCSNGEGSAQVVPGTGLHLNNMLGEEDLNPEGLHRHPPGRRLPSMMAPTLVLRDGRPEIALGSAGSNRIRSAILQTIVGILDRRMAAGPAVHAPRVHFEAGTVWAEPGIPHSELAGLGWPVTRFRGLNMFFGGAQAVERDSATGELSGGGDPRRGGTAVVV